MALGESYEEFVGKFKPRKTTDDCYTPPEVMEVVNGYVADRWHLDASTFVRPFWPGADFTKAEYPQGCTVVDNPPFSILSRIKRWYLERGIPFFLFCPSLTAFSSFDPRCDVLQCSASIVYANGAVVRTGFVTSLPSEWCAESVPDLGDALGRVCDELRHRKSKELPAYAYPDELLTGARLDWMAAHHTRLRVRKGECVKVTGLDEQRAQGKAVFGGGLLLSERMTAERAAAERAAAERAAAHRWRLSDRERRIVQGLDKGGEGTLF